MDEFFRDRPTSRQLFDAVFEFIESLGETSFTVTKSQVAFRRAKVFAWAWIPGRYLRGKVAPLVLTLSFASRDPSPRWKEIVEPARGRYIHHLELHSVDDLDNEVKEWLRAGWEMAGRSK
ncbi:MAG: DUF5655 domain-containing protein [Chloroflexi bacterium]|nr:DUF5655 domain-containing protein [Chloroflexota bacterium]